MGTLQSFTPLPESAFTLFLLNPSRLLSNLLQNQKFKQHYKFQTQKVDKFPLNEILDTKCSSGRKKIKVIVEEENLIQICHFALLFHHQIVIIKKELSIQNSLAKLHKEIRFKDEIIQEPKIYSPIEVQCLKHCASIQMRDLKLFVENHDDLREQNDDVGLHIVEPKWMKSQTKNPSSKNIADQANDSKKNQQLQEAIKVRNYKRRSTNKSHQLNFSQQQNFLKVNPQQFVSQNDSFNINPTIPYILFSHTLCPFNPISLIFNHIPQNMTKKIMNLLKFYKATFVRYPSLETFIAAGCNSTKIICGSTELEDIGKKVEADEYPFNFFQTRNAVSATSFCTLELFHNESMNVHHQTAPTTVFCQPQDITIYCFCNEAFEHSFTTNSTKLIGILKDKLIEIKFFKNVIQLVKQLFKDQHIQTAGDILKEILKEKALLLSNKKLMSSIETGAGCQGDNQNADKLGEGNAENDPMASTSNEVTKNNTIYSTRKDSVPRLSGHTKLLAKMSQMTINRLHKTSSYISGQHSRPSVPNLHMQARHTTYGPISKDDRSPLSYINSTVYFFMHQKENDRYSIQSLPKKIARGLKNMKVKKVFELDILVQKIQHQYISIVILSDNPKILQEFYAIIELKAVQDKIILIKREQSDTHETLVKKVNEVRQIGLLKVENFHLFSFINRKIIVMGSKGYLKHILSTYPYIDIKEFIDITIFKERRKIREVITRKNEIIVSNMAICQVCNLEYRGLIKAKIIYYESQNDSKQLLNESYREDCKCGQLKQNPLVPLKLDKMLDMYPCNVPLYPYMNKKIHSCSTQISALFTKIKEKKSLPTFEAFPNQISEIIFLCADSWTIEQITTLLVRLFANRYSSIWLSPWMTKKVMYDCVKQCEEVVKFLVDSVVSVYKGQISTKSAQIIGQGKEVYRYLWNCFNEVGDVYQFSEALLELFIENALFRKAVNYAWRNLLALNKHEYPFECCTLFLVLFLGFRKAAALNRNDSINNGTFSSFKALKTSKRSNGYLLQNPSLTVQEEKENFEKKDMLTSIKVECSIEKNGSFVRQNSYPISQNSNSSDAPLFKQTYEEIKDEVVEEGLENSKIMSSPKIYLKLMNYEKVYDDQSMRKFFISKNNAFSYIYTTEFLVFEIIDEKTINAMISSCVGKNRSLNKGTLFGSRFSITSKNKFGEKKNSHRSSSKKDLKKDKLNSSYVSQGKSAVQKLISSEQPMSPLLSSLLSPGKSQSKFGLSSSPKVQKDDTVEVNSSKNIEILPTTDDSLIICIENIELLNYNIFMPFYRPNQTKKKQKKTFILPPFTKLQINNNYSTITTLQNPTASLITHQLKLSPEHQQRFLEKVLETFLVEKSEYNGALKADDKIEEESEFQIDSSTLFGMDIQENNQEENGMNESRQKGVIVVKSNLKIGRSASMKPTEELKLVDQNFKLPYTDQFFILMNEFKYFSAHYLLISHLPKTNMTNAYHAILLTRKGLYYQAQKMLFPSNPFRFTVQKYINELRNRMMISNSISQSFQDQSENVIQRPQVMKWKVSYASKEEKFFLKDPDNPDVSYCYNDDSLDVIYKQVFTNFHNKTDLTSSYVKPVQKSVSVIEEESYQAQIGTGTFVNTKKPTRRFKKQSSIAQQESILNSLKNSREKNLSDIGLDTSTISGRSLANKMSKMSRDSILNDMRFFQQIEEKNPILSGMSSGANRRSRISHSGSSSFMFGSPQIKKVTPIPRVSNRHLSYKKDQSFKNGKVQIDIHEQIEEKESNSSQSEDNNEDNISLSRIKYSKMTPIHVRTRNKSNFFVENVQQLKKQKSLIGIKADNEHYQSKNELSDNDGQTFSKSLETDELSSKDHQLKLQKRSAQSMIQKYMNEDQQDLNHKIRRYQRANQSLKGPIMLFKNFQNESDIKNDSWITSPDYGMIKSKFSVQEVIQETAQPLRDSIDTHRADREYLKDFDPTLQTKSFELVEKNQDLRQETSEKQTQKRKDESSCEKNSTKSIQKLRSIIKKTQIHTLHLKKSVQSETKQNSSQREKPNKQKCRFTLDISSESSDQDDTVEIFANQESQNQSVDSPCEQYQKKLCKRVTKSLFAQSHNRIKTYIQPVKNQLHSDQAQQNAKIPAYNFNQEDSSIDYFSNESETSESQENRKNENFKESEKNLISKRQIQDQLSQSRKNVMNFTFKKKNPGQTDSQRPSQANESKNTIILNQAKHKTSKENNFQFHRRQSQLGMLNCISEASSPLKTTQSEEQILRKDHEEFLSSNTQFFVWHQKQQTQKHLKSSKKLLKSVKQMISTEKAVQNEVEYSNPKKQSDGGIDQNQAIRRKQKKRSDKNSFTFMRPSTGPENKPVYMEKLPSKQQIDPQKEHIVQFHSQLMNNSSIFDPLDTSKKSLLSINTQQKCKQNKLNGGQLQQKNLNKKFKECKNEEKLMVFIKKQKKSEGSPNLPTKQLDLMMSKTTQDYNFWRQKVEIDRKLNFSSDKPLSPRQSNKMSKKQSHSSWYSDQEDDQKMQQTNMASLMNSFMNKKKNLSLERKYNNQEKDTLHRHESKDPTKLQNDSIQEKQLLNSRQKQNQTKQQCKIHRQELFLAIPDKNFQMKKEKFRRNAEFCEGEQEKSSPGRLNMASLRNLKMNCDIRRKR